MKYFFSLLLSIAIISIATAQDFKKVEFSILTNKTEDAKTELEKVLSNPKNQDKVEGYYWKSRIYAALYKDSSARLKYPQIFDDANLAFEKYCSLDTAFSFVKNKGPEGFFDMYSTTFKLGTTYYQQKKYEEASKQFKSCVVYSDYMFKNKWTNSQQPFDTTVILYCGISLQSASQDDEAVKYFIRLANSRVSGDGNSDIYNFILVYYIKKKNKEEFNKYLVLSKELYPKIDWDEYELEFINKNYDLEGKAALYDEMDNAGTMTENTYFEFGGFFINAKNQDGIDSLSLDKYNKKAQDAYKKAFNKNNNNAFAAYNLGFGYFNLFSNEDDKYRINVKRMQELNSSMPVIKDPKKKIALENELKIKVQGVKNLNSSIEKVALENADLAIEWYTKTFMILKEKTSLTKIEKSIINTSIDKIANLYEYKMSRVRGKDEKLFNQYEAKYKEFDALHSKF